jgi:hypothetical protein
MRAMNLKRTDIFAQNAVFLWIALVTTCILLVPLIAMQFTGEVTWTGSDFVVAGALLFGAGSLFVLAARRARKYWPVIGLVFLAALLYVWAELAVGVFTDLGS